MAWPRMWLLALVLLISAACAQAMYCDDKDCYEVLG